MHFTIGSCFCFGQKLAANCEKPLPAAYWDETCLSLLASCIFCESRNNLVVLFTCVSACAPVYNRVGDSKKKKKEKYLLHSFIHSCIHQKRMKDLSNPRTLEPVKNNQTLMKEKKMWCHHYGKS